MNLRPLDDPALDEALARLDRKRHKSVPTQGSDSAPPAAERVFLAVTYERKDEAKRLGARWSPVEKKWWLPADRDAAIAEARKLGFLH